MNKKEVIKIIDDFLPIWIKRHGDCKHKDEFGVERLWYIENFLDDLKFIINKYEKTN